MFVGEKLDLIDNDASKCCGGWVYASSLYSLSLIKLSKTDYTASCNCKVESNAFSFRYAGLYNSKDNNIFILQPVNCPYFHRAAL